MYLFPPDVGHHHGVLLHPGLWESRRPPPHLLRGGAGGEERAIRLQANHCQDTDFLLQEQVSVQSHAQPTFF